MTVTWDNPGSGQTVTNGGLTVTHNVTDAYSPCSTLSTISTGKWYCELLINYLNPANGGVGVIASAITLYPGEAGGTSWGYTAATGYKQYAGTGTAYGFPFTTGDVIGIAVDLSTSSIWFSKNGVWANSGDPANGVNPAFTNVTGNTSPALGLYRLNTQVTGRFTPDSFQYTPPVGFFAFDLVALDIDIDATGGAVTGGRATVEKLPMAEIESSGGAVASSNAGVTFNYREYFGAGGAVAESSCLLHTAFRHHTGIDGAVVGGRAKFKPYTSLSGFGLEGFLDRPGRIWFNLLKYGEIHGNLTGSLEELEFTSSATGAPTGSLLASLEALDGLFSAASVSNTIGHLSSTLEPLSFTAYGAFIENYVSINLENFICEWYGNMGLSADLEYLSCGMQSLFGASIETTIEELDIVIQGNSTYVSIDPIIRLLGIEMHAGSTLGISFSNVQSSGLAYNEILANLKATLSNIALSSATGYSMAASMQPLSFNGVGNSYILGELIIQTRNFTCTLDATTESLNNLIASLRNASANFTADNRLDISNALVATLANLDVSVYAVGGYPGSLNCAIRELTAELLASSPSTGALDSTLERLEMRGMLFIDANADGVVDACLPYKVLEFEGI